VKSAGPQRLERPGTLIAPPDGIRSAVGAAGTGIQPPNQTLPQTVAEVLLKSAESVPEIATLYVFSFAHSNGSPQLTVGVGLDRKVAKEREQLIVQTLWTAVAPSLTELKILDFIVMTGPITAAASAGNKIYQRF
jgi:hypothetical protein